MAVLTTQSPLGTMARCYQCGAQTDRNRDGPPFCARRDRAIDAAPPVATLAELNARLNDAPDEYRRAMGAQREALELKRTLSSNNPDQRLIQRAQGKIVGSYSDPGDHQSGHIQHDDQQNEAHCAHQDQ